MIATEITNWDDVIDSRNVIERMAELEQAAEDGDSLLDFDERTTLMTLKALAEQCENGGVVDWEYGVTLIRDSYFIDYAQETAEDIGAIDPNAGWPTRHIDWEAAADELKMDYTSVDFDGVTYWVR